MRISDWSSDVCSSDLPIPLFERVTDPDDLEAVFDLEAMTNPRLRDEVGDVRLVPPDDRVAGPGTSFVMAAFTHLDRKSVAWGESVSVRVDLGGRRIIKQKKVLDLLACLLTLII